MVLRQSFSDGLGRLQYSAYLPRITDEDMRLIAEPIDVYAQNIYNGKCQKLFSNSQYSSCLRIFFSRPMSKCGQAEDLRSA